MSHSVEPADSGADDLALVRRCQAGQSEAFDQLVVRHQQQAFAVAIRLLGDRDEATDVAQDAFIRAYRGIGRFRGEAKFSTWLLAIVINLCRNRRRWWARRRQVIGGSLDEPVETEEGSLPHQVADDAPDPSAQAVTREQSRFVMQALQALDEEARTVIVLRDLEGLSYEEIAGVLKCRIGTVKSRLSRARFRLRGLLDGRL
ncbi:MAG: sigma-70 family RNA polymerase sigma factor [Candidatus Omnitrophica bacterium]|nr:sigma-70 family RNA polymerase sigma factor [Candidatus Omnitrophota bacterium]